MQVHYDIVHIQVSPGGKAVKESDFKIVNGVHYEVGDIPGAGCGVRVGA